MPRYRSTSGSEVRRRYGRAIHPEAIPSHGRARGSVFPSPSCTTRAAYRAAVRSKVGVLTALAVLAGCGGSSRHVIAGPEPRPALTRCAPADLKLSLGPDVTPETGEHPVVFVLSNRSRRSCTLDGYPRVILTDRRRRLAFIYTQGGGYVTKQEPHRVTLTSRHRGYFLVAQYRCDGHSLYMPTMIRVWLPNERAPLALGLDLGAAGLNYCKRHPGDLRIDPGNRVVVSPIEPSVRATLPL